MSNWSVVMVCWSGVHAYCAACLLAKGEVVP